MIDVVESPGPGSPIEVHTATSPEGVTVSVRGELDVSSAGRLRSCLFEMLTAGPVNVTIDLAGLSFIDSTGLGVLVGAVKRAREQGGDVVLRDPTRSTRKVLEISGLAKIFDIVGDQCGRLGP